MAEALAPPFDRPDRGFNDLPGWSWVGTYGGYYLQADRLSEFEHGFFTRQWQGRGPEELAGATAREDGSIAAPYVPTEMALTAGLIEPRAVPAVTEAMNKGINTVSSGTDQETGRGFAIGAGPDGRVVKVIR